MYITIKGHPYSTIHEFVNLEDSLRDQIDSQSHSIHLWNGKLILRLFIYLIFIGCNTEPLALLSIATLLQLKGQARRDNAYYVYVRSNEGPVGIGFGCPSDTD